MGNCPRKQIRLFTSPCALDQEIKFFACSYPGCSFKSQWLDHVGRHEKIHNGSGECAIPCQVCLKTFRSLVSFFHHLSTKHADKLFCPFCQFVTQDLTKIKTHVLTHSLTFNSIETNTRSNTGLRCSTCSKTFTLKGNLTQHLKNNRCKVIHTPATIGSLKAHTRTPHHDVNGKFWPGIRWNKRYASFTLNRNLDGHEKSNGCGSKPFASAAKKTQNVASFTTRKPKQRDEESRNGVGRFTRFQRALYACRHCSFTTYHVTSLRRHYLVHNSEMPFECSNLGCDYRSRFLHNLQRHQRNGCKSRQIESKTSNEGKESLGAAVNLVHMTQVNKEKSSSRSVALACMFCNFVGDSKVSALKHSRQHKSVVILLNRIYEEESFSFVVQTY